MKNIIIHISDFIDYYLFHKISGLLINVLPEDLSQLIFNYQQKVCFKLGNSNWWKLNCKCFWCNSFNDRSSRS